MLHTPANLLGFQQLLLLLPLIWVSLVLLDSTTCLEQVPISAFWSALAGAEY